MNFANTCMGVSRCVDGCECYIVDTKEFTFSVSVYIVILMAFEFLIFQCFSKQCQFMDISIEGGLLNDTNKGYYLV